MVYLTIIRLLMFYALICAKFLFSYGNMGFFYSRKMIKKLFY